MQEEASVGIYPEDIRRLADLAAYQEAYKDHPTESQTCGYQGCRMSVAEHHRLAYGLIMENQALRKRVQELERHA